MPTNSPTRQPTGQFSRLAPVLAARALRAGTSLPVVHGDSQPDLTGPVLRFTALSTRYGTPVGYTLRLQHGDTILAQVDVADLPEERLAWQRNRIGSLGAFVRAPDMAALTNAAQQLTRRAGRAA